MLPSFIGVSAITCWIGFKGYVKSQGETSGFSNTNKNESKSNNPIEAQKLVTLMITQKPYLNPDLNLQKLSELLQIPPKATSYIINHDIKMNFYEFVNKYRVEEFKNRAQKKDGEKYSLIGLAYECGFNSKSTFNHIFKKNTGQTPGEYYRKIKKSSEWKQSDD
jgi:AraC-like DNA-binding protein